MTRTTRLMFVVQSEDVSKYAHCANEQAFRAFIETVEPELKLSEKTIQLKGQAAFQLDLKLGDVALEDKGKKGKQNERFVIVTITAADEQDFEQYASTVTRFRKAAGKLVSPTMQPTILRDDISLEYARQAYVPIHRVENLMRELITRFMVTQFGTPWTRSRLPEGFQEKARAASPLNLLQWLDFIDLADVLMKKSPDQPIDKLEDLVTSNTESISVSDLKEFIPTSNWDRYFRGIVAISEESLSKKWKRLYQLRCTVAHNRPLTKDDCEHIKRLSSELEQILEKAITKLPDVHVPDDEKEQLQANLETELLYKYKYNEALREMLKDSMRPLQEYPREVLQNLLFPTEVKTLNEALNEMLKDSIQALLESQREALQNLLFPTEILQDLPTPVDMMRAYLPPVTELPKGQEELDQIDEADELEGTENNNSEEIRGIDDHQDQDANTDDDTSDANADERST